jgi:hypothetical protein
MEIGSWGHCEANILTTEDTESTEKEKAEEKRRRAAALQRGSLLRAGRLEDLVEVLRFAQDDRSRTRLKKPT